MMKMAVGLLKLGKDVLTWDYKLLIKPLVVAFSLLSCVKAEEIPPKTREGKNTLAYQVDERFVGGDFNDDHNFIVFVDSLIEVRHHYANLRKHHPKEKQLSVILKYDISKMQFFLDSVSYHESSYGNWSHFTLLNSNESNFLEVTYFSKTGKIVSGEFDLYLVRLDSLFQIDSTWQIKRVDSVRLRKGRFDLKFY